MTSWPQTISIDQLRARRVHPLARGWRTLPSLQPVGVGEPTCLPLELFEAISSERCYRKAKGGLSDWLADRVDMIGEVARRHGMVAANVRVDDDGFLRANLVPKRELRKRVREEQ